MANEYGDDDAHECSSGTVRVHVVLNSKAYAASVAAEFDIKNWNQERASFLGILTGDIEHSRLGELRSSVHVKSASLDGEKRAQQSSEGGVMDCWDNSCIFAEQKGGMRTNGGCRCLKNREGQSLTREDARDIQRRVLSLEQGKHARTAERDQLKARVLELERERDVAREAGRLEGLERAQDIMETWGGARLAELRREIKLARESTPGLTPDEHEEASAEAHEAAQDAYERGRMEERDAVRALVRLAIADHTPDKRVSARKALRELLADIERGEHVQAAGEAKEQG